MTRKEMAKRTSNKKKMIRMIKKKMIRTREEGEEH